MVSAITIAQANNDKVCDSGYRTQNRKGNTGSGSGIGSGISTYCSVLTTLTRSTGSVFSGYKKHRQLFREILLSLIKSIRLRLIISSTRGTIQSIVQLSCSKYETAVREFKKIWSLDWKFFNFVYQLQTCACVEVVNLPDGVGSLT